MPLERLRRMHGYRHAGSDLKTGGSHAVRFALLGRGDHDPVAFTERLRREGDAELLVIQQTPG